MRGRRRSALLLGCLGSVLMGPSMAVAETGRGFRVDPIPEGIMTLGVMIVALVVDREKHQWTGTSPCGEDQHVVVDPGLRTSPVVSLDEAPLAPFEPDALCDRARVPPVDRWVTRLSYTWARPVSDAAVLGLAAAPVGVSIVDRAIHGGGASGVGEDLLVIAQTYAVTLLTTGLIKVAAQRPRPLTHNKAFSQAERFEGDSRLSFPSGHSSMSFAAASVGAFMLFDRYGFEPGTITAVSAGYAVAASVATFRILGGKHFLTDVLAGAFLGTVVGLGIPWLHRDNRVPEQSAASLLRPASTPVMMAWSGAF